ncbi:MAG: CPBP family intramembrane metalloprotease [Candidatus Melainabacteria bacterium]|nr:CPBP family intramembrane metalloprotease [Candidatus Melainabacteria bacterium]
MLFKKDELSKFDFLSFKEFILVIILLVCASILCFLYIPITLIKLLPAYAKIFASNYFGIILALTSSFLTFYIIYYFCCKRKNKSLVDGLFFRSVSKKIYTISILIGIIMPLLSLPIIFNFAPKEFYAMDLLSQEGGLLELAISATIAPVFEEIFYRGFIFPFFQSKFNSFWAIILTGLFFGLSHFMNVGNAMVLLSLFVFYGFILTFLRYFSNSLVPPIITHLLHNAVLMGGFFVFGNH